MGILCGLVGFWFVYMFGMAIANDFCGCARDIEAWLRQALSF